jgi:hypothetical protein
MKKLFIGLVILLALGVAFGILMYAYYFNDALSWIFRIGMLLLLAYLIGLSADSERP